MHDAVGLERRGRPTAVVVTEAFVREAALQREALGAQLVTPVVIDHPLSTLSDEAIGERAQQAIEQVEHAWRR